MDKSRRNTLYDKLTIRLKILTILKITFLTYLIIHFAIVVAFDTKDSFIEYFFVFSDSLSNSEIILELIYPIWMTQIFCMILIMALSIKKLQKMVEILYFSLIADQICSLGFSITMCAFSDNLVFIILSTLITIFYMVIKMYHDI